jgi:hypothetical protein
MGFDFNEIKNKFSNLSKKKNNNNIDNEEDTYETNEELNEFLDEDEILDDNDNDNEVNQNQKKVNIKKEHLIIGSSILIGSFVAYYIINNYDDLIDSFSNEDEYIEKPIVKHQNQRNYNKTHENKRNYNKTHENKRKINNTLGNKNNIENNRRIKNKNNNLNSIKEQQLIKKSTNLIKNDNTDDLLKKIQNNSNDIKTIVNDELEKNMKANIRELSKNVDPFLMESIVVVDNNYHKKVMLSQVQIMKEFMKYLDIKKQFDDSIKEYKDGKVKILSIEEKIIKALENVNIETKFKNMNNKIKMLQNRIDNLNFKLKQKDNVLNNMNSKLENSLNDLKNGKNLNTNIINLNDNTKNIEDQKLKKLLNNLSIPNMEIYTINNTPIVEILDEKTNKIKIYHINDTYKGFKISNINNDGILLSFIDNKGIEKTKFINSIQTLDNETNYDVLIIDEAGFSSKTTVKSEKTKKDNNNFNKKERNNNTNNNQKKTERRKSLSERFLSNIGN